jgi:hypothetical protein
MPLSKEELEKIEKEAAERVAAEKDARDKALAALKAKQKAERAALENDDDEDDPKPPKARKHEKGGDDVSVALLKEVTDLKNRHPEFFKDAPPPEDKNKDKNKNVCGEVFCLDPFCTKSHGGISNA